MLKKRSWKGQLNTLLAEKTKLEKKIEILQIELKQVSSYIEFLQKEEEVSPPNLKELSSRKTNASFTVEDSKVFHYLGKISQELDLNPPPATYLALVQIQTLLIKEHKLDLSPVSKETELCQRILS